MPTFVSGSPSRASATRTKGLVTGSVVALGLALLVAGPANAQAAKDPKVATPETTEADSAQTGDIIVTARRVDERLQDRAADVSLWYPDRSINAFVVLILQAIGVARKITVFEYLFLFGLFVIADALVVECLSVKALGHDHRVVAKLGRPEHIGADIAAIAKRNANIRLLQDAADVAAQFIPRRRGAEELPGLAANEHAFSRIELRQ